MLATTSVKNLGLAGTHDEVAQSYFQWDRGGKAEVPASALRIAAGVVDVADAGGTKAGGGSIRRYRLEGSEYIEETTTLSSADVANSRFDATGSGSDGVDAGDIENGNKVTSLCAIAEQGGGDFFGESVGKSGDHTGVGGIGILALTVNIEVAQADGVDAVRFRVAGEELFGGQLGGAIHADRRHWLILTERKGVTLSVAGGG